MQNSQVTKTLCDLIALDHDAIAAYEQAIRRIGRDEDARDQLALFKADHERHVHDLVPIVKRQGGEPPRGGDFMRVVTSGKVVLFSLLGDMGILRAMRSNEETTNQRYENALRMSDLEPDVRIVLERNLADERRHRAWLEARIMGARRATGTAPA